MVKLVFVTNGPILRKDTDMFIKGYCECAFKGTKMKTFYHQLHIR